MRELLSRHGRGRAGGRVRGDLQRVATAGGLAHLLWRDDGAERRIPPILRMPAVVEEQAITPARARKTATAALEAALDDQAIFGVPATVSAKDPFDPVDEVAFVIALPANIH